MSRPAAAPLLRKLGLALAAWRLSFALHAGEFSGERAMADIKTQCAFGPRVPGTPAHVAARDWIKKEIEATGLIVWEQPFDADLALTGKKAPAWNLWALPKPEPQMAEVGPFMLVGAHWDTRPVADNDPAAERTKPFLGANDGGSGVAIALEIARSLRGTPAAARLALVFFDAEDAGVQARAESWCIGSQFAANNPRPWLKNLKLGINLDMVGGKDLKLGWEGYSQKAQPEAVKKLWRIGRDLAPEFFLDGPGNAYIDDHYWFIKKGLPFIDLIGLPYPFWHRTGDAPEACDPRALEAVGRVAAEFVRRETR